MKFSHIIGIDPGLNGAIALIDTDTGELFDITDMPTTTTTKKGKKVRAINADQIVAALDDYLGHADRDADVLIVIEQQSTRPGLAAGAIFKTGYGYGVIIGAAAANGATTITVRPQAWKAAHGLIGAGGDLKGAARTRAIKTASRQTATLCFPYHADMFKRAKDDGRAEAALIASAHLPTLTRNETT